MALNPIHARAGSARLIPPAVLARVDRLELVARQVVSGYLSGMHRSSNVGASTDFAEHRSYTPGDDIRRMDWRVYGRTDRLYIKTFQAETNTDVVAVIDQSASMQFSSHALSKLRYATILSACIAHLAARQRDRFGAGVFDVDLREIRMPRVAPGLALMHLLEHAGGTAKTDLDTSLAKLADRLRRRTIIFVMSDFYAEPADVQNALARLAERGHDVIATHILDPGERSLPWSDAGIVEDMETGTRVPVDPRTLNTALQQAVDAHCDAVRQRCSAIGIDYQLCMTDQPLDQTLQAYLERRKRSKGRG